MNTHLRFPFAVIATSLLLLGVPQTSKAQLRFLTWNIESGGNDAQTIAEELRQLNDYDVYALSEVNHNNLPTYTTALQTSANRKFRSFHSVSGGHDRLAFIFDKGKLELVNFWELFAYNGVAMNDGRHRSPLMAQFRNRATDEQFLVTVNHLARRNAKLRQTQAKSLRLWATRQTLPVIGLGDFNFDYDFASAKGNPAHDEFIADNVWQWVKPNELIDTNWSDDGKGNDRYPGSCLDFTFVAGKARRWNCTCQVIVRDGDFPDDDKKSDHRPVELIVTE
jgi:endonuclease/exonuclease/phosphatase family metal-dependent hydrolase